MFSKIFHHLFMAATTTATKKMTTTSSISSLKIIIIKCSCFMIMMMLVNVTAGLELHCNTNNFVRKVPYMQFTKETINQEYVVHGQSKMLHCCAENYRSIEWLKNGKPYPWTKDQSSFILLPEAENQTIYTNAGKFEDAGNYTCVLRNATTKSEHHTELKVQDTAPDTPLATYRPQNQFVELEEPVRLYCEAFIGTNEISSIAWYQVFEDEQEQKLDGIKITNREQIIGAYLNIPHVKKHSYGQYLCRIEISNEAHRLDMSVWLFGTPYIMEDSLTQPILLAISAAVLTIALLLTVRYLFAWYIIRHKRELNICRTAAQQETKPMRSA